MSSLVGLVIKSSVGKYPSGPITELKVKIDDSQEVPYYGVENDKVLSMNLKGRHLLGGRKVKIDYEYHTGVFWVESYDVLNEKGEVIHSDVSG